MAGPPRGTAAAIDVLVETVPLTSTERSLRIVFPAAIVALHVGGWALIRLVVAPRDPGRRTMSPWRPCAFVVLLVAFWLAPAGAHEVVVEYVVDVTLVPDGNQLLVRLRVPAAVVGDPTLPALLRAGDAGTLDARLRIVAADVAHNLDLRQDDATLQEPIVSAHASADRVSIEVELRYAVRDETTGFSARLNAFTSTTGVVRTTARFRAPSGADQITDVSGPPKRIVFDPAATTVIAQFAARGMRALLDSGDALLFLVCLLVPYRRVRSAVALFGLGALGQAVVMTISMARPPYSPAWLTVAAMVAASTIVIAALENVARARTRWALPISMAFGVCSGVLFGHLAAASAQFAGANRFVALFTFGLVVVLGELWLGALAWVFRIWLAERGVPERVLSIGVSALIAHEAVHRVLERGHVLAQDEAFWGEHALVVLTLGWIAAILLAAASNARSGYTVRTS